MCLKDKRVLLYFSFFFARLTTQRDRLHIGLFFITEAFGLETIVKVNIFQSQQGWIISDKEALLTKVFL